MEYTVFMALKEGQERLRHIPEPKLDTEYLLAEVLHTPRLSMLLNKQRKLTQEEQKEFQAFLLRREQREPLQYILGTQDFMGFTFHTDARALIPRNDTEALCEEALRHLSPGMAALDLCTGSGALAISLQKLCPGAEVYASDLSPAALSLARENAESLHAAVHFLEGDLFAPFAGQRFHLILSNPPYIPDSLRGKLQEEVEKEPAMALFGGSDGLLLDRKIIAEAPRHLYPGGWLMLELGDGQFPDVEPLLQQDFEKIQLLPDLSGLPRVVSAQLKEKGREEP